MQSFHCRILVAVFIALSSLSCHVAAQDLNYTQIRQPQCLVTVAVATEQAVSPSPGLYIVPVAFIVKNLDTTDINPTWFLNVTSPSYVGITGTNGVIGKIRVRN